MSRKLHFNLFLHDTGHHEASWRLPGSDPYANLSLAAHQRLARIAEDARFDSVFLADSPVLWSDPGRRPSGHLPLAQQLPGDDRLVRGISSVRHRRSPDGSASADARRG